MPKGEVNRKTSVQEGRFLSIGLIPNFAAKFDKIDFGDFSIEKFDRKQVLDLFPKTDFKDFVEFEVESHPYFVVIGKVEPCPEKEFVMGEWEDKDGGKLFSIGPLDYLVAGIDYFKSIILLLNLFHRNNPPFFVSTGLFRWISDKNTYMMHQVSGKIFLDQYILYGEDGDPFFDCDIIFKDPHIDKLLQFKKQVYPILCGEYPKLIKVALNFFYDGCFKEANANEEMANLDYAIALESLFLTEGQELKYKFANRLAVLFGDTDEERLDYQRYGDDVYWLRSKIVHGEYTKEEIQEKLSSQGRNLLYRKIGNKWVVSIREITRLSINYFASFFLRGIEKQKDILPILDKALFSESDRKLISEMRQSLSFLR